MKKRMMSLLMALTMSLTLLRTEIEATTEDGTETLSLASWSCDDEVMRMAEGHSHCICGESHKAIGEHNGEDSVSFDRKLSSNYTGMLDIGNDEAKSEDISGRKYYVLPAGSYYLDSDVYLGKSILIKEGTVNICLNGHKLCLNHGSVQIWEVIQLSGGTLNLTDCKGTGQVCHFGEAFGRGVTVENSASFTLYGGTIYNNQALASSSTLRDFGHQINEDLKEG